MLFKMSLLLLAITTLIPATVKAQGAGLPECASLYALAGKPALQCLAAGCLPDLTKSQPKKPYLKYLNCKLDALQTTGEFKVKKEGGTLLIGDSNIDYWLTSGMVAPGSINAGVAGSNCQDWSRPDWTERLLTNYKPSVVVLHCGANDVNMLGRNKSPADAVKILSKLVEKILKSDDKRKLIFYGATLDNGKHTPVKKNKQFNELAGQYFNGLDKASKSRVQYIDVGQMGSDRSLYWASDQTHLTQKAYDKWDMWLKKALAATHPLTGDCGDCLTAPDVSTVVPEI